MRRTVSAFDMPLFIAILILIGMGIPFIYSASYPKAMVYADTGGDALYYTIRQIVFTVIGLGAMTLCSVVPLHFLRRHFWWIALPIIALMLAVPVFGREVHGNLSLGPFQPSEFLKVAIVLCLPAFVVKKPWLLRNWRGMWNGPFWFLIIPVGLVVLQKDLGTALIVTVATGIFLLIAGAKPHYLLLPALGLVMLVTLAVWLNMAPDRINNRLHAMMDPFNTKYQESYHPRNSLIAVGSGGVLGRGFCNSRQKWFYLPGSQNDYILAVIAEELGFLKMLLVIFLPFCFLIYRGFYIANRAPDEYAALVAAGCTVMLATQALINMGVVVNFLPSMGINLPFISYGGSSLVASMAMGGFLLNVSMLRTVREHRQQDPAEKPTRQFQTQ